MSSDKLLPLSKTWISPLQEVDESIACMTPAQIQKQWGEGSQFFASVKMALLLAEMPIEDLSSIFSLE